MRAIQSDILRLKSGFSLIQVSILLTVASLVMVSMLPGAETGNVSSKNLTTMQKMQKIEQATSGFIAAYGRRPCPASGQYAVDAANFGIEAANNGSCTGGTPAAPLASGNVVQGTVPTKTLNLPDEYAFDDWGRQITYVVDKRATARASCTALQNYPSNNGTGGITVKDSTSGSTIASVMALYISHGPDGHGAFPIQGSTAANRINIGSTDTDTLNNASVDTNFNASVDTVYIQKEKTATYDDITYFAQYQKNKCCIGLSCYVSQGFRIDGNVTNGGMGWWTAHGDVNGDGYQDLILGTGYAGIVYVIFGTPNGFANPLSVGSLDGSNGFAVSSSYGAGVGSGQIAVADVDGDGIGDIIMGTTDERVWVLFGKACGGPNYSACSASYSLDSMTSCQATMFYSSTYSTGNGVAVGDFDGDGIADFAVSDPSAVSNKGKVWVVFGRTKTCPGTPTFTTTNLNSLTSATVPRGSIITGTGTAGTFGNVLASTNINNDAYTDILIADPSYGSGKGRLYVIAGQASANWPSTIDVSTLAGIPVGACPSPYNTCGFYVTGGTSEYLTNPGINGDFDVTGDGIKDIIIGGGVYVIKGSTAAWSASYTPTTLNSASKLITLTGGGAYGYGAWITTGDVNKDGVGDIVIGSPNGEGANGSYYVVFGGASLANRDVTSPALTGTDGVRFDCPSTANSSCGSNPEILDINGDGTSDLVLGVQHGNVTGSNAEGYAYTVYGKTSGWTSPYSLSAIY